MKQIITFAAILVVLSTNASFANDSTRSTNKTTSTSKTATTNGIEKASFAVQTAFNKDFRNTEVLNTEIGKNFTKLTFRMSGIVLFAFYSESGNLLAVTRNILSHQLPITLQIDLKSNYSGYWITDLFELTGEDQNAYYITLENANHKVTLRSNANQAWEVYEKTDKE
jgi:hypothetical protein